MFRGHVLGGGSSSSSFLLLLFSSSNPRARARPAILETSWIGTSGPHHLPRRLGAAHGQEHRERGQWCLSHHWLSPSLFFLFLRSPTVFCVWFAKACVNRRENRARVFATVCRCVRKSGLEEQSALRERRRGERQRRQRRRQRQRRAGGTALALAAPGGPPERLVRSASSRPRQPASLTQTVDSCTDTIIEHRQRDIARTENQGSSSKRALALSPHHLHPTPFTRLPRRDADPSAPLGRPH
jgi:hypothetical protein